MVTLISIYQLTTIYGVAAILTHLGRGPSRPNAFFALLSWPTFSLSGQASMFQGQLQTHISSSKKVPSCCKRIKKYLEKGRPSWSHLTCLKPAVAHFALAEGVFAGSLRSHTCHIHICIWRWKPLKSLPLWKVHPLCRRAPHRVLLDAWLGTWSVNG